jgi:general secretion pathway protein A
VYDAYYGFRTKPFSLAPQEEFLFPSRQHRMAIELLVYALGTRALFTVIVGDIGTGKTTLLRHLFGCEAAAGQVAMIRGMRGSFEDLLRVTCAQLMVDHRGHDKLALQDALINHLERRHAQGDQMVLVIDEAQSLAPEVLEELRLFSNINAGQLSLLQIVLVGQLALRQMLRRPEMNQLAQRVAVDYLLVPLNREQSDAYIRHRLRIAGPVRADLFSDDAVDAIFCASGGVPRVINLLCDMALVYGYADQKPTIDAATVEEMLGDKARDGGWLFQGSTQPTCAPSRAPAAMPPIETDALKLQEESQTP